MGFSAFVAATSAMFQMKAASDARSAQRQAQSNLNELTQTLTEINKPHDTSDAANKQRKRTAGAQGQSAQVLTGPSGLGEIGTQNREVKTLLGY